jgi:hypothetical protein
MVILQTIISSEYIDAMIDSEVAIDIANKLDKTSFSGLTKISVGTDTPSNPQVGDLWVDTN